VGQRQRKGGGLLRRSCAKNKREDKSSLKWYRFPKRQIKHHPTMPVLWYNSNRRYLALEARWTLVPITERYGPRLLRLGNQRQNGQVQSTSWGHNLRVFPRSSFLMENRLLASSVGRHSGGAEAVEPRWPFWRVRSHHWIRPLAALNLPRRRWTAAKAGGGQGLAWDRDSWDKMVPASVGYKSAHLQCLWHNTAGFSETIVRQKPEE
jgi:hypothetical protein